MNNINEIIVPNIPELSFSVNCINIDNNATVLRGRHFHKEFEIFRIDDGVMQLNSGEENLELRSGDVAFINSFYIHEIKAISSKCKATYIQIDLQPYINAFLGSEDNFLYHYINSQYSEKYRVFRDEKISNIISDILSELTLKDNFYDMQIKSYIYQLIVYMLRYNFITNHKRLDIKSN